MAAILPSVDSHRDITKAKDAATKKNEKQCIEFLTAAKKVAGVK